MFHLKDILHLWELSGRLKIRKRVSEVQLHNIDNFIY